MIGHPLPSHSFDWKARSRSFSLVLIILLTAFTRPTWPASASPDSTFGKDAFSMEFSDLYYFAFTYYISLTGKPFPKLDTVKESIVYHHLLSNSWKLNCLLFSLGIYPAPIVGAAIKAWAPHLYNRTNFLGFNFTRFLTESVDYAEPWSISVFLGNVFFFKEQGEITGQGSIGLLSSYGYYSIVINTFYPDNWGEFEAKLKVDKSNPGTQYSISYRIGGLIHSNHDFRNIIYFGFRHDRTDWVEHGFSFIKNTILELRTNIAFNPLNVVLFTADVGKKWPTHLFNHRVALGVALGVIWYIKDPYRGELGRSFQLNALPIISPRLNF
jgi:hypothetical protein